MLLRNHSQLPTAKLKPLANVVGSLLECECLSHVHVLPRKGEQVGCGFAFWENKSKDICNTPSKIEIYIDQGEDLFPYRSVYKPSVGAVVFRNWQEEFIFTLAHEGRHIDQYWSLLDAPILHREVDAERFAFQALYYFRRLCYNKEILRKERAQA